MKYLHPLKPVSAGFLVVSLALILQVANAAPGFVQHRYVAPGSGTTRTNVGFSAAQSAGNLNVVAIGWRDSAASVVSVTDTRGNAYRLVAGPTVVSGVATQAVYVAENILAAPGGGNIVKLAFSAPVTGADVRIAEYSGVATASAVMSTRAGTGSAALTTSGPVTTTGANTLLVATTLSGQKVTAAGSGFTKRIITPRGAIVEDMVAANAGTYTPTATQASSSWYIMHALALRPAGGGASVPAITLAASPTSVNSGASSMLNWSSSNATGCTASGGWSGGKTTSGSVTTGALNATTTYSLTCNGTGGSAAKSATVSVAGGTASRFPLRVEAGKRYLVDAQGRPFLVQGDSPWLLITNLTREEVVRYLDDRQAKGFNTLLVELLERNHSVNQPANIYGDYPFTAGGEFSAAVEAYFSHAEYVVAQARQRGMLVLLTPSYMGYAGRETGWYPAMGRAGPTALRAYGQYVGNRFRAYNNILWVHGGDYNPPDRARLRAVVNGILDVETASLHTFHGSRNTSALGWLGTSETWLDVNNIYTGKDNVVAEAQGEYNASTMPYFLIEGAYEDETANPTETRQQAWQAVLSGAAGQVTGQEDIWPFTPGAWTSVLNTEGASTLVHLRTLLEAYPWWTLQPDFANAFLTGGVGTGAARAPAARSADRTFGFVYTRDVRDLTINMNALAGPQVRARWYDPTSGTFNAVAGSPFAASGSRVFRPTGNNARGKADWVLVLDAGP